MANRTKSVSGATTTYTITDNENVAMTVAVTQTVAGNTTTIAGTAVHYDALNDLAQLCLQLATNLVP